MEASATIGALVDLPTADEITPLMIAAGMGHGNNPTCGRYQTDEDAVASLKILARAGAELDLKDRDGRIPLDFANGNYRNIGQGGGQVRRWRFPRQRNC